MMEEKVDAKCPYCRRWFTIEFKVLVKQVKVRIWPDPTT